MTSSDYPPASNAHKHDIRPNSAPGHKQGHHYTITMAASASSLNYANLVVVGYQTMLGGVDQSAPNLEGGQLPSMVPSTALDNLPPPSAPILGVRRTKLIAHSISLTTLPNSRTSHRAALRRRSPREPHDDRSKSAARGILSAPPQLNVMFHSRFESDS